MALKVSEEMERDETVGEFIYRIFVNHIVTEETTDEIIKWGTNVLVPLIPLPNFFGWKEKVAGGIMDKLLPERAHLLFRDLLQLVGLLDDNDRVTQPRDPFRGRHG